MITRVYLPPDQMLETLQQKEPLSEFVDVAERNRKNQDHGVSRVDRLRWGSRAVRLMCPCCSLFIELYGFLVSVSGQRVGIVISLFL